jgi:hypothetical protein
LRRRGFDPLDPEVLGLGGNWVLSTKLGRFDVTQWNVGCPDQPMKGEPVTLKRLSKSASVARRLSQRNDPEGRFAAKITMSQSCYL